MLRLLTRRAGFIAAVALVATTIGCASAESRPPQADELAAALQTEFASSGHQPSAAQVSCFANELLSSDLDDDLLVQIAHGEEPMPADANQDDLLGEVMGDALITCDIDW